MAQTGPTTQDVLDELRAFREEMGTFREEMGTFKESMERKVDDLTELVQATANGYSKRFDAIERRLDGKKPLSVV